MVIHKAVGVGVAIATGSDCANGEPWRWSAAVYVASS